MANDESILELTKLSLDIVPEEDAFDQVILMHINSVFFDLAMLGVGPEGGFHVDNAETKWSEFIGADKIAAVKSYMQNRVRLLFDPPTTSFALESLKEQSQKMEWLLNVHMEGVRHP